MIFSEVHVDSFLENNYTNFTNTLGPISIAFSLLSTLLSISTTAPDTPG